MSLHQLEIRIDLTHPDLKSRADDAHASTKRLAALFTLLSEVIGSLPVLSDNGAVCSASNGEPLAYWVQHSRDNDTQQEH